jgi:hypothetical protein
LKGDAFVEGRYLLSRFRLENGSVGYVRKMPLVVASIASFSIPAWRSLRCAYTARFDRLYRAGPTAARVRPEYRREYFPILAAPLRYRYASGD